MSEKDKKDSLQRAVHRNKENYQKYLSYLLRHPSEAYSIQRDFILSEFYRNIYDAILHLQKNSYSVTLDEVLVLVKQVDPMVEFSHIEDIYNSYDDFSNIEFIRKTIKDEWLKEEVNKKLLEEILIKTTSHGELDLGKLKTFAEGLSENINLIDSTSTVFVGTELAERYEKVLLERDSGAAAKRTTGTAALDTKMAKPFAVKQITTLFGYSGSGKSLFALFLINCLINLGIPVIYVSLEMSEEDTLDRLYCMREDISIEDLMSENKSERLKARIKRGHESLKALANFALICEDVMSIDKLGTFTVQAKEKFIKHKVMSTLKDYAVVVIDLSTMLTDFGDLSAQRIEQAMNKLHQYARRHDVHVLQLVQANENQLRGGTPFTDISEIEDFKLGRGDIKNGAAIYERSRAVFSIMRRKQLLSEYFPEMEEIWEKETDLIKIHCLKQSMGKPGFISYFAFDDNFRIFPTKAPSLPKPSGEKE